MQSSWNISFYTRQLWPRSHSRCEYHEHTDFRIAAFTPPRSTFNLSAATYHQPNPKQYVTSSTLLRHDETLRCELQNVSSLLHLRPPPPPGRPGSGTCQALPPALRGDQTDHHMKAAIPAPAGIPPSKYGAGRPQATGAPGTRRR
jgi:hypothetical protein